MVEDSVVNRQTLRDLLDLEGVDRQAYRLDGSFLEQALTLGVVPGGWRVSFTERGIQIEAGDFETEDEACHVLAERLLSDNSNRWVLVAGPADAVTADAELAAWLSRVQVPRNALKATELRTEDLPWTATEMRRRHWVLRTVSRRLPSTPLRSEIVKQVNALPEFRMGVHRVAVRLTDGRVIPDVFVSGNQVSWVFGFDTIPFAPGDIAEVVGTSFW